MPKRSRALVLAKVAARSAYYAAFHAAEAFIVERTGKIAKTHSGVRTEFARLLRETPESGRTLLRFLAQAYKYKELGDYGIGLGAVVTDAEARDAIEAAERFIERVTAWLIAPSSG